MYPLVNYSSICLPSFWNSSEHSSIKVHTIIQFPSVHSSHHSSRQYTVPVSIQFPSILVSTQFPSVHSSRQFPSVHSSSQYTVPVSSSRHSSRPVLRTQFPSVHSFRQYTVPVSTQFPSVYNFHSENKIQ